jgi:hypothetical protein
MSICIEIVRADGRIQRQMLAHERTTVGSSDQASVVVADAPELEPLHILLVPRDRGVWLSAARNARTPVLLDGKPFESGELGLGTEVDIGSITVRIATADDDGKAKRARNIVLLVVAAVVAVPFLGVRNGDMPPPASEPAPPLFAPVPSDCPAEGDAAELRGAQAVERAMSKTLRYPFDPREKQLRQRIEDDYQLMRLNLERALGEEDWKQAAAASSQLLALLADRPGAYRDWLLGVQRFLELRLSEQKEKSEKDGPL